MKQVNELSPELAKRASLAAAGRGDPRGETQAGKFSKYAINKISSRPKINFQAVPSKAGEKVAPTPFTVNIIRGYPEGHSAEVQAGKNGYGMFKIGGKTLGQPYAINFFLRNEEYRVIGFDRPSAMILSKEIGLKPTELPLLSKQSSAPQTPEYTIENIMKEDLRVQSFSLKQIIENMEKIPEKTGKFGEPSNTLSQGEKKKMLEMLGRFNKHGQSLRGDQAIREAAKELSELANMAKKYAMNENNSDFIQKETVQRDFRQMDGIVKEFQRLAQECVNKQGQLAALYEDYGNIMERYYSMENISEAGMSGAVPEDVQTELNMSECGTCGCGNPHNTHGETDTETTPGAMLSKNSEEQEEGMM
jgi:hypothetical protein